MSPRALSPVLLALCGAALGAQETPFVGPRATAMGGAAVAATRDAHAQYHNPATLGFMGIGEEAAEGSNDNNGLAMSRFDLALIDATGGARFTGDIGERLDELAEVDVDGISNGDLTPEEAQDLVVLAGNLAGIDDPANTIQFDANLGTGLRIGHWAVGLRGFGALGAMVQEVDLSNLGLPTADPDTALDQARDGGTPTGSTLSQDQKDDLAGAGISATNVDYLDSLITAQVEAGAIDSADLDRTVDILVAVAQATDSGGGIEDNATAVTVRGLGVLELPVSYGYAITPDIAVGATVKLMRGRVYGRTILVFDEDNDQVIEEATEEYQETTTFGIDLAAMWRLPTVTLGVRGSNLNRPDFDGFTTSNGQRIDGIELDPQLTLGVAWNPIETLTLAADVELLEQDAVVGDYQTRFVNLGVEWDIMRALALRAGAYHNTADDEYSSVITLGLGLRLATVRLDLAAASALDTVTYDGEDMPEEARVSLGLGVDF